MQTDKFIRHSRRLEIDDVDWDAGARAGLSGGEPFVLRYFRDVESHTVFYFRELLDSQAVCRPEVLAFLTTWNYEEYFHGEALGRLLEACGHGGPSAPPPRRPATAALLDRVQGVAQRVLSRAAPDAFLALYMTWGASQELLTLRGYEQLERTTANPVLRLLARRIARQERRHFAWYLHGARELLAGSPAARAVTRAVYQRLWAPVGAGVRPAAEVDRMVEALFPGPLAAATMGEIADRIATLPGLDGADAPRRFAHAVAHRRRAAATGAVELVPARAQAA